MRKIFIDCGFHDGCSVRKFIDITDKNNEYEYFCYEMNKELFQNYQHSDDLPSNIKIYNSAVSTYTGEVETYCMGSTGGSTIDSDKKLTLELKCFGRQECMLFDFYEVNKIGRLISEKVECIDLNRWIRDNFNIDDHVVLKMDIEGAEYDILDKLLNNNTFTIINQLLIEFHMLDKLKYQERKDKVLKSIKEQNPSILIDTTWDAMHSPYLKNEKCEEYFYKCKREKIEINFRKPLKKEEKIIAVKKFIDLYDLERYMYRIYKDISWQNLSSQEDFITFRIILNDCDKIEEWKEYINKIAIEEIRLK